MESGFPEDPADCPVGIQVCMKVARCIGDDWKWLGRAMGIEDYQLDSIEEENKSKGVEEMANKLLNLWKREMAERATVRKLNDLLIELDRPELVEQILVIGSKSKKTSRSMTTKENTQATPNTIMRTLPSHPEGSYTANSLGDNAQINAPLAGHDQHIHQHIHQAPDQPLSEEEQICLWESLQASLQHKHKKLQIPSMPWQDNWELKFEHYYVELTIKSKEDEKARDVDLHDIFCASHGETPKRVLIDAPAGYGKTTLAMKLCYDHSHGEEYIRQFDAVILLHLRHFEDTLSGLIIKTLNLKDFKPEHILASITRNQRRCLFVLDGLDELPQDKLEHIMPLLKAEEKPQATVIVTSRVGSISVNSNEAESLVTNILRYIDNRIVIKGLVGEKKLKFLKTYLNSSPKKLSSILALVDDKYGQLSTTDLFDCPLFILIFVIIAEESDVSTLGTKTELYKALFNFILRRMFAKKGVTDQKRDFFDFNKENPPGYVQMLSQFGLLALQSLLKSQYMFTADEIRSKCGNDDIFELGILKQNDSKLGLKRESWFEPVHQSFLEFSAAYHCCVIVMLLLKHEVFFNTKDMMKINVLYPELKLIIPFFFGLCGKHLINGSSILWNGFKGKYWLYNFIKTVDLTEIEIESHLKLSELGAVLLPLVPEVISLQKLHSTKFPLIKETLSQALRVHQLKCIFLNIGCSVSSCETRYGLLNIDCMCETQEGCAHLLQGCDEIITHQNLFIHESNFVCKFKFTLCEADLDEQLRWLSDWLIISNLPIRKAMHKIQYSCSELALPNALTKLGELISSEKVERLKIYSTCTMPRQWLLFLENANVSQQLVDINVTSKVLNLFILYTVLKEKKWRSIELQERVIPLVVPFDPNNPYDLLCLKDLHNLIQEPECFIYDLLCSVKHIRIKKEFTSCIHMFNEAEVVGAAEYVFVQSDCSSMINNLRELYLQVRSSKCIQAWNWAYLSNLQVLAIKMLDDFKADELKCLISGLLLLLPNCHPTLRLELNDGSSNEFIEHFVQHMYEIKRSAMGRGEKKAAYQLHTLFLSDVDGKEEIDSKGYGMTSEYISNKPETYKQITQELEIRAGKSVAKFVESPGWRKEIISYIAVAIYLREKMKQKQHLAPESFTFDAEVLALMTHAVGIPVQLSGKTLKLLKELLLFGNLGQLWIGGHYFTEGFANREVSNIFTSTEGFICEPVLEESKCNGALKLSVTLPTV